MTGDPNSTIVDGSAIARKPLVVLLGLFVLACGGLWFQGRTLGSVQDSYLTSLHQLQQMRQDAKQIQLLQHAPKEASGRSRANEELLALVEQSLAAANIDRNRWQDSIPQPPVRLPNRDYTRHTTRLYYQDVTVKQLATFWHDLERRDSTIQFSALSLANRDSSASHFDAELAISYLVYAP